MAEIKTIRSSADYINLSQRFTKQTSDFTKQYCNMYTVRLGQMKILLKDKIIRKWGDQYPVCDLHKLAENSYPKCIVIGTLFKDQTLKPSVLKQLAEANSLIPQPILTHFTDETDSLFMEDELQRYQLLGLIDINHVFSYNSVVGELDTSCLVTGITCALLGTDLGKGKFMVDDYCFAGFQAQIEYPLLHEDVYIVFISGLDLVHIDKVLLPLRLFVNWIVGLLGDINNVDISKIVRLIVAGNSTQTLREKAKTSLSMTSRSTEFPEVIESVKLLDTFLYELSQAMEVDVMPGEHDPSNHILPQQPMHHCMFPKAITYKSFNSVSNPYECQVHGVQILGTSGQPITDILNFSDIADPLDALECCLKWNHLAPTAPDTLGCFPFYEVDPFILENCPHVMFVGNGKKFGSRLCKGEDGQTVRLICVPEFATTFSVCVLNLKNLECFPITFNS